MGKNLHKKVVETGKLVISADSPDNARKKLLLENEKKMREATSRQQISEIADQTLVKLAQLYGESVNALDSEIIRAVYKPAFVIANTLEQPVATKKTVEQVPVVDLNDGFCFELFLNEIETLADSGLKNQAKNIFYNAIDRIRVGMDRRENYVIAERASKELKELYRNSQYYAHDYARLEGQLFRAVGQRNQFFKKVGKWQQSQSLET